MKPLGQQKSEVFDRYRDNDDDDFDSFDDSDDEENHQQNKKSNDFLNSKQLPEPPSNQNSGQVYAFVQRIKNFGSISKNEISKGISKFAKKRGSIPKIPTSRSQFYENSDETNYIAPKYESKSLGKKSRGLAKLQKLGRLTINKLPTNFNLNDPFEHSGENESNSSPNLSKSLSNFNSPNTDADKNERNIKNMFRKGSSPSITSSSTSNIYGALSNKSSTFYVTDSVDVDSGIFAVNEKSTSSPDNSNLNLSTSIANSSSTSSCDMKRRSIASINGGSRPNEPPPAPPTTTRRSGSTSWYAECGLFNEHEEEHNHDDLEKNEKNSNSWYTESGLYQTSNTSVAR